MDILGKGSKAGTDVVKPEPKLEREDEEEESRQMYDDATLRPDATSSAVKEENSEYDDEDRIMMSGRDAEPDAVRNLSDVPGEVKTSGGFVFKQVKGDLFTAPDDYSLCHCVSRDFALGKVIHCIFILLLEVEDHQPAAGLPTFLLFGLQVILPCKKSCKFFLTSFSRGFLNSETLNFSEMSLIIVSGTGNTNAPIQLSKPQMRLCHKNIIFGHSNIRGQKC